MVARLVSLYGVFDTQRNVLRLRELETVKSVRRKGPVTQVRSAIRFVTPVTWGFCPELKGAPWRGRLSQWPAAELAGPIRRHRLNPRHRRFTDQEDSGL